MVKPVRALSARRSSSALAAAAVLSVFGGAGCGPSDAVGSPLSSVPALTLLREAKLSTLLSSQAEHYEASGVTLRDGFLYIVFDNLATVGVVNVSLSAGSIADAAPENSQYEGITLDSYATHHFYVVKETDGTDPIRGRVIQLDSTGAYEGAEWTDVTFSDENAGFEGIAWLRMQDSDFLLALCEGNHCEPDRVDTGHGRIKVLEQDGNDWRTKATLALPAEAAFRDYADLALYDNGDGTYEMAVVSQESSAMWLGQLTTNPLAIDGPGSVYAFPSTGDRAVAYCDVEGVTFLTRTTFAMVSDKTSGGERCEAEDESVHVFALP